MAQRGNLHLQRSTKEKLAKFDKMRGREVVSGGFWDVVVITAVDESQRSAYELQISEKLERKELPLGVKYHVFADPPGYKIGNGGSTLHSIKRLCDKYAKLLSAFKVLLIHAGGFSQRLPSASALGKIFTALPLGKPLYQMLELKLAMYVDFPAHMKPGMLVTCADDIELYSVSALETVVFDKVGFTALAHPSPLSIGTTHGVFVLAQVGNQDVEYGTCSQFLHKPTVDKMRKSQAVFTRDGEELVYTDSTYYVDYGTMETLLSLFAEITPVTCEIDAYGDFLQALGEGATVEYTQNTENVTKKDRRLVEVRESIFHHLKGTALNVVVLNNSKFYHIGTTEEYLLHFTLHSCLGAELGLLSDAFSLCPSELSERSGACVMHSVLHPSVRVSGGSVIEFSRLEGEVAIGPRCLISGCWVDTGLSVPSDIFMHSLSISVEASDAFVTLFIDVRDDLKKNVPTPADMKDLSLLQTGLDVCISLWGLCPEKVRFSGDKSACSLWNACIFPVCSDLKVSFITSLKMLNALRDDAIFSLPRNVPLTSLQEALQNKNLNMMLDFRKELYEDICRENTTFL